MHLIPSFAHTGGPIPSAGGCSSDRQSLPRSPKDAESVRSGALQRTFRVHGQNSYSACVRFGRTPTGGMRGGTPGERRATRSGAGNGAGPRQSRALRPSAPRRPAPGTAPGRQQAQDRQPRRARRLLPAARGRALPPRELAVVDARLRPGLAPGRRHLGVHRHRAVLVADAAPHRPRRGRHRHPEPGPGARRRRLDRQPRPQRRPGRGRCGRRGAGRRARRGRRAPAPPPRHDRPRRRARGRRPVGRRGRGRAGRLPGAGARPTAHRGRQGRRTPRGLVRRRP